MEDYFKLKDLLNQKDVVNNIELYSDLFQLLNHNSNNTAILTYPSNLSSKSYQYLLDNKLMTANQLFEMANSNEEILNRDKIIDLSLTYKVKFATVKTSLIDLSDSDIEKCLNHGLKYALLVKSLLMEIRYTYNSLDIIPNNEICFSEREIQILSRLKEYNIDINNLFEEIINQDIETNIDNVDYFLLIPMSILETLVKDYHLNPNLILKYAVKNAIIDVAELSLKLGANVNETTFIENIPIIFLSILQNYGIIKGINRNFELDWSHPVKDSQIEEFAMSFRLDNAKNNTDSLITEEDITIILSLSRFTKMYNFLITNNAKVEITAISYVILIMSVSIDFMVDLFQDTTSICNVDSIYDLFRANGASESNTQTFIDIYNLINDYALIKSGQRANLNEVEVSILDKKVEPKTIEEYRSASFTNKYGFGPLHLSIIAEKHDLTIKMIKSGFDLYAKSKNSVIPLQLIEDFSDDNKDLIEAIIESIDGVDIDLEHGESLVDVLLNNDSLGDEIIERTQDPLFYFLKQDSNPFAPMKNLSKTYIAISEEEGHWSTGVWSASRLILKNYPDVVFHLVKSDAVEKYGEKFLQQFDGFINPGADDSFPKTPEFTKDDCEFSMPLEIHYQNMLEFSDKNNVPYLGMCAGAQHFSLYHNGTLKSVEGYALRQHQVTYIKGSLAYFIALTKDQQNKALSECDLPDVVFMGDTAHHYAADPTKLGNNIQLGALSEDGVAMSYSSSNGMAYVTQFHPEHQYDNIGEENAVNQISWLNSFVELAIMHHDFRVNNAPHPIIYFSMVQDRLQECLSGINIKHEDF